MWTPVEPDVRDRETPQLRRPDRAAGMPGTAELDGRHGRDACVERRQRCHRVAQRTLAVDDADARPRARAARVPAAHRGDCAERCARRRPRCRSSNAAAASPARFARAPATPASRPIVTRATARRRSGPSGSARRSTASTPIRASRSPTTGCSCGDWWDGDSSSPTYNRFRHVTCGATPPFAGRSEPLWREPSRLPGVRVHRVQRVTGTTRSRRADLPARRPRPRDERLPQPAATAAVAAPAAAATRRADHYLCIILIFLYSSQRE